MWWHVHRWNLRTVFVSALSTQLWLFSCLHCLTVTHFPSGKFCGVLPSQVHFILLKGISAGTQRAVFSADIKWETKRLLWLHLRRLCLQPESGYLVEKMNCIVNAILPQGEVPMRKWPHGQMSTNHESPPHRPPLPKHNLILPMLLANNLTKITHQVFFGNNYLLFVFVIKGFFFLKVKPTWMFSKLQLLKVPLLWLPPLASLCSWDPVTPNT